MDSEKVREAVDDAAKELLGFYRGLLHLAERDLAEIDEAIRKGEELIGLSPSVIRILRLEGVTDELPTLRQRKLHVAHWQASYGADIAAIQRVRDSWWMDEVYSLLAEAFAEDDEEAQARKVRGNGVRFTFRSKQAGGP